MAALPAGVHRLSSDKNSSQDKDYVFMKLTDSALRALEEYMTNSVRPFFSPFPREIDLRRPFSRQRVSPSLSRPYTRPARATRTHVPRSRFFPAPEQKNIFPPRFPEGFLGGGEGGIFHPSPPPRGGFGGAIFGSRSFSGKLCATCANHFRGLTVALNLQYGFDKARYYVIIARSSRGLWQVPERVQESGSRRFSRRCESFSPEK